MITKIGKEIVKEKGIHPAISAIEGIGGTGLLANAVNSGQLTGRATLYHGTDRQSARGILEKGLLPTSEENAVNTTALKADPERYKKALGKSYMTRSAMEALSYSIGKSKRQLKREMPCLVRVNAPLWKMKQVMNPEADMPYAEWEKRTFGKALFDQTPEFAKKSMYRQLRKSVVIDGAVEPEYIRGSTGYRGNSFREFRDYVKAKPKTFALGAGKSLLGGAALLHGGYETFKKIREHA